MNENQIIEAIQVNLGIPGLPGQDLAKIGYSMALNRVGRVDVVPWNKEATTFDTISGTSSYLLETDIFTSYSKIRGLVSLFRTDVRGQEIPIYHYSLFNRIARGSTTTGQPEIATLNGRDKKLELYYVPDGIYTIWAYLRFALYPADIPDEYIDMIVWDAVLCVINAQEKPLLYQKAKEEYAELYRRLESETLTKVEVTQIRPAYVLGNVPNRRRKVDSGNKFGMG